MPGRSYAAILIAIILCATFPACNAPSAPETNSDNNEWTGTISFLTRTTENKKSKYNTDRYIEEDFMVESRMEASFEEGKGIGTQTSTLNRRSLIRDKISVSYTHEEITTEQSNTYGTGPSDLAINVDPEDKVYSIEATIPESKGTRQVTFVCKRCPKTAAPQHTDASEEASMIQVERQELGDNPDVLSGEIREITPEENGHKDITIIQWSFVRGLIDAELIVTPVDYNNWLPIPGASESTPGNQLHVQLKVQGKNGKAPRFKVKSFELELQGTSQEPGVAINYPLQTKAEKLFDLQFADVDGDGQVIHVDSDNGSSGSAIINAFDGGAYATLKATAILEGGIRIQGHLLKADGSTSISIPFRTESSRIGASWSKVNGNTADNADEEKLTGNDYAGDGLTSYEEYRGVFSEGTFKRLSALKKELGVRVAAADKANLAQGINLFSTATGVQAIVLNDNELDKDRVINTNSIYAHLYTQHGVWLVRDDRGGAAGYNEPKELLNKTPAKSEKVVINVKHHEDIFTQQQAALKAANISMPYTMEQDLAVTVAHELGHSIHLDHHGPSFLERPRHIPANTPTTFLIYDYFGKQIGVPFDVKGTIGIPGNDASGDLNCIMAYTNSYQWVLRKQSAGVLVYQTVPATPVGNSLCTGEAGTGINKNDNFFGAAIQGNCRSRIRVRDQ